MRLFVAVYPPPEAIARWMVYKDTAPSWPIRWIPHQSLHLTLKFLGEVESPLEQKVNKNLDDLAGSISPFELSLKVGGVFPPKGAPSIFWVGIEGEKALADLANKVILQMKSLGFPAENRPYHSHMTVARSAEKETRLRGMDGQAFTTWVADFSSEPFAVNQISLVESKLGSTGSSYTVCQAFPLAG